MPNDVSYFKVPGDSTTYQFNDPDAESRIGALESTVNDQAGDIAANASAIGTLSNLTTSAKGSLVAAINEVDSHADTNASAISSLNSKFHYYASMADLYNAVVSSGYLLFTGPSALYNVLTQTTSSVRCYGLATLEPNSGGNVSYAVISAPGTSIFCGRLTDASTIGRLVQYTGTSIV